MSTQRSSKSAAQPTEPALGATGIAVLGGAALAAVRAEFPALSRRHRDRDYSYLDGPGGTQVPRRTIQAMAHYLERSNANHEGAFATSEESDAILAEAHAAAADFLGAAGPHEVAFGQNMTTLTFAVSRAIGRTLRSGDEVVVTRLDHDANVAPWLALEEERGVTVRWVDIRPGECTLDMAGLQRALGPRTRLVAVGLASNAVGTINPVRRIVEMAHAAGAWTYVDAVHAAPHMPIDVAALDTDFLVCSPYKFFGPHLGLLFGKGERLAQLASYKVRPAPNEAPGKWETGTLPGESIAGLLGTFDYLAWLGRTYGGAAQAETRREALRAAMRTIRATERELALHALEALRGVPGLKLRGIVDPARIDERVPTFAFTLAGRTPREVAAELGARGIAVWDGDYYAYELIRRLGLAESGGMVRVGLVHYNEPAEIDRLAEALDEIAATAAGPSPSPAPDGPTTDPQAEATRLIEAIRKGDDARIDATIAAKPELLRGRDGAGLSPILVAAYSGHMKIAVRLGALAAEAPDGLDVFEAATIGNVRSVEQALAGDRASVDGSGPNGFTALHLAAYFGQLKVTRLLLGHGADPNAVSMNEMRVTPLHSAVAARHRDTASLLLAHGASPNAVQHGGWTPLHGAAQNGDEDLVDMLLLRGADATRLSDDGKSAADLAEGRGHASLANLLAAARDNR